MNYCEMFQEIERNPTKRWSLTVAEFLGARAHVREGEGCNAITQRMVALLPPSPPSAELN